MSDTAEAKYKYGKKNSPKLSRAPQGRRLGDERLEVLVVLVALSELPRVGRNWAAVAYPRGKSREEARVSTQLVLNKYNTNYEALRLADSTSLAFNLGKIFIKANYYKLMNYHKTQCNTRFIKGHKPSNHIRARIKSHVYTKEWTIYHSTYHEKDIIKRIRMYLLH